MCASAISSGNAGLFAGAEGQNNEPSYSSPKETTDGSHSLPESSDITEEPGIPLKPVFHSDVYIQQDLIFKSIKKIIKIMKPFFIFPFYIMRRIFYHTMHIL